MLVGLIPLWGRFTSADTFVPQPGNPQAWDRYAYVNNSPLKYVDPTGHDAWWCNNASCRSEYYWNGRYQVAARWYYSSYYYWDKIRQDLLFSRIFKGSGAKGAWIADDRKDYYLNRGKYWDRPSTWKSNNEPKSWDTFAHHVGNLAKHYKIDQKDQFVRDFALVFGGVSTAADTWPVAGIHSMGGPPLPFLKEDNQGLPEEYLDSLDLIANQSHHYAGAFYAGYFAGAVLGVGINFGRDIDEYNPGDINLGNIAAGQGVLFQNPRFMAEPLDLPGWIDSLSP
jgi:hypothetical protein